MKIVAFVPAKGHSERIKNKNLQILDGDFLFKRKLHQLMGCNEIDEIYLDTEDKEIADIVSHLPVKWMKRPKELSTNATDGHELFAYECSQVDADLYIQALCTSPFIESETISKAIRFLVDSQGHDSLIGVIKEKQYIWEDGNPKYGREKIPNSIDLPHSIRECMGLYMVKNNHITKPSKRFGDNPVLFEVSFKESIDINNLEDLNIAEMILSGERAKEDIKMKLLKRYLSSSLLSDICKELKFRSVLPQYLKPIFYEPILGRAKTLFLDNLEVSEDWRGIYNALGSYRFIRQGDIIVVDSNVEESAYFGELNANLALRSGCDGAIINGYTRDSLQIKNMNFPVYAKGSYCSDIKYEGTFRSMNKPIFIGDIQINNGDYIFADNDGIVSIPKEKWNVVLGKSLNSFEREMNIKKAIINDIPTEDIIKNIGFF